MVNRRLNIRSIHQLIKQYPNIWTYHGPSRSRFFKVSDDQLTFELLQLWWYRRTGSGGIGADINKRQFLDSIGRAFGITFIPHDSIVVLRTIEAIAQYAFEYKVIMFADQSDQVNVLYSRVNDNYRIISPYLAFNTDSILISDDVNIIDTLIELHQNRKRLIASKTNNDQQGPFSNDRLRIICTN